MDKKLLDILVCPLCKGPLIYDKDAGELICMPARYCSTRLPGKPLRLLAGKTMLQHVHERARESGAAEVVIATDDERIREAAAGFGANVCMTAAAHRSGTDRLAEVAARGP